MRTLYSFSADPPFVCAAAGVRLSPSLSMSARLCLRVTLLTVAQRGARADAAATGAAAQLASSGASLAPRFAWIVQPPASTQTATITATASPTVPVITPGSSVRRARVLRPPPPLYASWASKLSGKVAEGQAWLAAAKEEQTWRLRAQRAFLAVQSRIDVREEALGQVFVFAQRARKYEQEVQQAEDDIDAADATSKAALIQAASSDVVQRIAEPTSKITVPPPTEFALTFLFPSSTQAAVVRSYLHAFAVERQRFHSQRVLLFALLVPVTAAATILPGPNIFLAFVAYRLLGHYQAREGANELAKLVHKQQKEAGEVPTPATDAASAAVSPVAIPFVAPCDDVAPLELTLESYDDTSSIDDVQKYAQRGQMDQAGIEKTSQRWSA